MDKNDWADVAAGIFILISIALGIMWLVILLIVIGMVIYYRYE